LQRIESDTSDHWPKLETGPVSLRTFESPYFSPTVVDETGPTSESVAVVGRQGRSRACAARASGAGDHESCRDDGDDTDDDPVPCAAQAVERKMRTHVDTSNRNQTGNPEGDDAASPRQVRSEGNGEGEDENGVRRQVDNNKGTAASRGCMKDRRDRRSASR